MKPLLASYNNRRPCHSHVVCKAHLSPQPHMASDDNAQATPTEASRASVGVSEEGDTEIQERQRKESILSE